MKLPDPENYFDILGFDIVNTNDACIVTYVVRLGTLVKTFTGTSKRHPTDKRDDRVGIPLAQSRALASMSRWLARQSAGQLSQNEQVQQMKPIQAAQRTVWEKNVAKQAKKKTKTKK